jgi:acyl-coenzyme A synthetase/AMP-(fatty) acid ligase
MAGTADITTYGKRLLPHIVDARAKSGYARPYALYPRTKDPADGFQEISYARLANAVNRAAWWLDQNLREAEEKENAFAYFGANDLRYVIFVLATMKTGRKVFLSLFFIIFYLYFFYFWLVLNS